MLCLLFLRALPWFAFLDVVLLCLLQTSHHPAGAWLCWGETFHWCFSVHLNPCRSSAAVAFQLQRLLREVLWWKGCHWQKAPQNDGHCHSPSPPGTKRPLLVGLQRHQSLWPYHPVLSLLSAAWQRFKKNISNLLLLSSEFSELPTRQGNNCPCLTGGKLKWSRCADRDLLTPPESGFLRLLKSARLILFLP